MTELGWFEPAFGMVSRPGTAKAGTCIAIADRVSFFLTNIDAYAINPLSSHDTSFDAQSMKRIFIAEYVSMA